MQADWLTSWRNDAEQKFFNIQNMGQIVKSRKKNYECFTQLQQENFSSIQLISDTIFFLVV